MVYLVFSINKSFRNCFLIQWINFTQSNPCSVCWGELYADMKKYANAVGGIADIYKLWMHRNHNFLIFFPLFSWLLCTSTSRAFATSCTSAHHQVVYSGPVPSPYICELQAGLSQQAHYVQSSTHEVYYAWAGGPIKGQCPQRPFYKCKAFVASKWNNNYRGAAIPNIHIWKHIIWTSCNKQWVHIDF